MKKTLLLFSTLLCLFLSLRAKAQITLTSPSPVYSNDASVTITAQGETLYSALDLDDKPILTATSIAEGNYSSFLDLTNITVVSRYTPPNTKSSFTVKITNTSNRDLTVTFTFKFTEVNIHDATSSFGNLITYSVIVKPGSAAPSIFYNTPQSKAFTKSNCGTGYQGQPVTYNVAANAYSSTISLADANSKALAYINSGVGQAYADANGTCLLIYYNAAASGSFYNTTCAQGTYAATPITYNVPANKYSSTVSQAAANAQATQDVTNNGQNFANIYGPCSVIPAPILQSATASGNSIINATYTNASPPINTQGAVQLKVEDNTTHQIMYTINGPGTSGSITGLTQGRTYTVTIVILSDPQHTTSNNTSNSINVTMPGTAPPPTVYYNVAASGYFLKNNCTTGNYGSYVNYIVPASTYTSLISMADANSKATNDVALNGQTYANNNGTCSATQIKPTLSASFGGSSGVLVFNVTPNIPSVVTIIISWTDLTTGQTGSDVNGTTSRRITGFTPTHSYRCTTTCYGVNAVTSDPVTVNVVF